MKAVIPGTSLAIHPDRFPDPVEDVPTDQDAGRAVLAGGCFWCVEAVYQPLDGVQSVVSGYAGGDAASANYEAVCSGRTGHAEVVEVRYDPRRISFGALLKLFSRWPTTPPRKTARATTAGRSTVPPSFQWTRRSGKSPRTTSSS